MAIKMTHKGIRPEDVLFTGTCTHCYSQYEANLSDLTAKRAEYNNTDYVAGCEVCGKEVYFTRKRNAPLGR